MKECETKPSAHLYEGNGCVLLCPEDCPKSTNAVLEFAGKEKDEIDYFFFHQANFYMVKKIIKS